MDKYGMKNWNYSGDVNIFVYIFLIFFCGEYDKVKR